MVEITVCTGNFIQRKTRGIIQAYLPSIGCEQISIYGIIVQINFALSFKKSLAYSNILILNSIFPDGMNKIKNWKVSKIMYRSESLKILLKLS